CVATAEEDFAAALTLACPRRKPLWAQAVLARSRRASPQPRMPDGRKRIAHDASRVRRRFKPRRDERNLSPLDAIVFAEIASAPCSSDSFAPSGALFILVCLPTSDAVGLF